MQTYIYVACIVLLPFLNCKKLYLRIPKIPALKKQWKAKTAGYI